MKVIRWILGRVILLLNTVFTPKSIKRSEAEQKKINDAVAQLHLYQFEACPFCVKVRRHAKRLNLPLATRDAKQAQWEEELVNGGGRRKVPCLRIEGENGDVEWMYESNDIINYLENRFA
ncbi:glutathione S-transferase N-terminal domain-containing protein [Photobacterium sp. OFAV2-7]|uniref:glutathione S-transferase N-terminal domain-containing protein n=1 Tax=Photobacterium sp. OFAV2-7 TaxID=2917748 RepID=UPI001EF4F6A2|nr:glutathione S-transferase N-terminal domain-containing protein [Photobacterium sp. OFAV2-7]MCG7586785.1 glutathione S-transferase N-terminal domain-containing protein [Photobacterium sp. OFAV2-7]